MENTPPFNIETFFLKFRIPIVILLIGLILTAVGIIYFKSGTLESSTKVEVLGTNTEGLGVDNQKQIVVEISGQVEKPGVYKFADGARVDELLTISGGFSVDADRVWTNKYLNRAAKLSDGQKIYIPKVGEQSSLSTANKSSSIKVDQSVLGVTGGTPVSINTGSLKDLDTLPGIGPTYAQNIIDHRPYSTLEELVSKGAIRISLFDKIKSLITIY